MLHVRVTPNAGADAINGVEVRDNGQAVLKVRVKALPDKGRANKAVVALLAKYFAVSKSAIRVVRGDTARQKQLAIVGDPDKLVAKLTHIAPEKQ